MIRASLDRTSSLHTDLDPSPGSLSLISRSEWKSRRYKPILDVALKSDEDKTVVQSTEKKLHCKFSYGTRMLLALPWLICHVTGCQIVPFSGNCECTCAGFHQLHWKIIGNYKHIVLCHNVCSLLTWDAISVQQSDNLAQVRDDNLLVYIVMV
jgi:hypothetical protein